MTTKSTYYRHRIHNRKAHFRRQGRAAALAGQPESANPYDPDEVVSGCPMLTAGERRPSPSSYGLWLDGYRSVTADASVPHAVSETTPADPDA